MNFLRMSLMQISHAAQAGKPCETGRAGNAVPHRRLHHNAGLRQVFRTVPGRGFAWLAAPLCVALFVVTVAGGTAIAQAPPLLNKALKAHQAGKLATAIDLYSQILKRNPRSAEALNWRGMAYDDLGKLDEALADFNRAIEISKNYSDAYNNRGEVYRKKKQYDKALADYTKAVRLEKNFKEAHYNMGLIYRVLGEKDRAIEQFTKYLQLAPSAPDKKQIQKMIQDLKQAPAKKPKAEKPKPSKKVSQAPDRVEKEDRPVKRAGVVPEKKQPKKKPAPSAQPPKAPKKEAAAKPTKKDRPKTAQKKRTRDRVQPPKPAEWQVTHLLGTGEGSLVSLLVNFDWEKMKKGDLPLPKEAKRQISQAATWIDDNSMAILITICALYVFLSLMLFLVARKVGIERAWLAFVPIVQVFIALSIAGKPAWWFVLLLIPPISIVIYCIVAFGIAEARGKSALWAVLMIIPVTLPIAWLYLALSK